MDVEERWFVLGKIKMALVRLFIGAVNTKGSRGRKKSPVLSQVLTSALPLFASFSRKNKKVKTSLSQRRHVLGFQAGDALYIVYILQVCTHSLRILKHRLWAFIQKPFFIFRPCRDEGNLVS